MEIKPMVYKQRVADIEVLAHDTYRDYEFAIVSFGTHPCAYVGIPKGHRFYRKDYDLKMFDNIPAHCGLTYSEMGIENLMQDKWVIGWDYAHSGDYTPLLFWEGLKRWSTEEILEEVKAVIDEIIKEEDKK